jgi:hypothetical protein
MAISLIKTKSIAVQKPVQTTPGHRILTQTIKKKNPTKPRFHRVLVNGRYWARTNDLHDVNLKKGVGFALAQLDIFELESRFSETNFGLSLNPDWKQIVQRRFRFVSDSP